MNEILFLIPVGIAFLYSYLLKTNIDSREIDTSTLNKLEGPGVVQILFACFSCILVNGNWIYTVDSEIDSFLNGSLLGNIIGLFMPNINYGDSIIGMLIGDTVFFLICIIFIAFIQIYGISKRKSRIIVETASVLGAIFCVVSLFKILDVYDILFSYKKQEGIIEYVGFSLYQQYFTESLVFLKYILPLIFIIVQFRAHDALNQFYGNKESNSLVVIKAVVIGSIIALIFSFTLYSSDSLSGNSSYTESNENFGEKGPEKELKIIGFKPIPYDIKTEIVPVQSEHGNTHVSIDWPLLIENETITSFFQRTICKEAFGVDSYDIKESVRMFFNKIQGKRAEYKYDVEANIKVKFKESIGPIAVCNIEKFFDFGGAGAAAFGAELSYHYDCEKGFLLSLSDIISDEQGTLEIINDIMKKDDKGYDQAASKLPETFQLTKEGVSFIFPKYELGPGFLGNPKFFISYKTLYEMMTPYMREKILTSY